MCVNATYMFVLVICSISKSPNAHRKIQKTKGISTNIFAVKSIQIPHTQKSTTCTNTAKHKKHKTDPKILTKVRT